MTKRRKMFTLNLSGAVLGIWSHSSYPERLAFSDDGEPGAQFKALIFASKEDLEATLEAFDWDPLEDWSLEFTLEEV